MQVIVVRGGTLVQVVDMLCKAFGSMQKQLEEFNELIKIAYVHDEEPEYKEHISFPCMPVKVMKSQVIDRKPKCIRARTVC
ncbi:hypothetical protein CN285_27580 [Bacillus cereus]|uniref:hypothetical protein n=1 Tax=Bacillus paramycoides TaxID=2026194 RepID=UPI000BF8E0A4|nr:hypothetical protein [Bacillus paramycoides]PFD32603.1 hypothetical protein CN285_27580 [Bacillus cereus]PGM57670.1 hypothetical protein CN947_22910 [Bacillus cereus]